MKKSHFQIQFLGGQSGRFIYVPSSLTRWVETFEIYLVIYDKLFRSSLLVLLVLSGPCNIKILVVPLKDHR